VVSAMAAGETQLSDDRVDDLKIAVSEACTNAIEAHDALDTEERVVVECWADESHLEVRIEDRGTGFDVSKLPEHPPITDPERLRKFCESRQGVVSIVDLPPRVEGTVVGEITSMRIVPRAGSPSLEATMSDGTASLLVVWTGRRKIAGVAPGKRLVVSGRGAATGPKGRLLMFNPSYELL